MQIPASIPQPWLRIPSLPYQQALDHCAAWVHPAKGPVGLLAGDAFYLRELLKRLSGKKLLFLLEALPDRDALGVEISWDSITVVEDPETTPDFGSEWSTLIWAEPQPGRLASARKLLAALPREGTQVLALTSNRFRTLLPEWKTGNPSLTRQPPLGARATLRFLRQFGFTKQTLYGFQGPLSVAYGLLARPAALLNRPDVMDRLFAATRRSLRVQGRQALWATLTVIVARRGARHE